MHGLKLLRGGQDGDLLNVGLRLADRLEGHLQDLRLPLALLMGGVRRHGLKLGLVLRHHGAGVQGQLLDLRLLQLLTGLHELDGHLELEVRLLLVVSWRRGVDGGQGNRHRHLHGMEALVLPH